MSKLGKLCKESPAIREFDSWLLTEINERYRVLIMRTASLPAVDEQRRIEMKVLERVLNRFRAL